MPGEAGPPLTAHDPSTPRAGVDGVSTPDTVTIEDPSASEPTDPTTAPDAARSTTSRPSAQRRRRLFTLLAVVAVVEYASDQVTKAVALSALSDGEPRPLVGDVIRFKLIGNPGAALSLGASNTWVMTGIALAVLAAIVFVARDLGSRGWALALGLLLGSAVGNLTDRFVRPPGGGQGHVVDFIDYNSYFIGNVADIWIVGAAGLIVVLAMLGIGVDGRRERDIRAAQEATAPEAIDGSDAAGVPDATGPVESTGSASSADPERGDGA